MQRKCLAKMIAVTLVAGVLLSTPAIAADVSEVNATQSITASEDTTQPFISLNPEGIKFDKYILPKNTSQLTPFYTNRTKSTLTYSGNFLIRQYDSNGEKTVFSITDSKDIAVTI